MMTTKFLKSAVFSFVAAVFWAGATPAFADQGNENHQARAVPYPLIHAAYHGDLEEVERLLAAGASPNDTDTEGLTALMISAFEGHLEVVEALLKAKADPNAIAKSGGTVLDSANLGWSQAKALSDAKRYKKLVKVLQDAGAQASKKKDEE